MNAAGSEANFSTENFNSDDPRKNALSIILRMEVNQRDPAGITVPYQLIVPALSCEVGAADGEGHANDNGGWI
jgi:hypothetical protein